MSVADDFMVGSQFSPGITPGATAEPLAASAPQERENSRPMHRLAEVRRQQGISVRSVARRMGVSMTRVRNEEKPGSDLTLSDLARWQAALEVPLADLLVDDEAPISAPVLARARWLRLMKTVKALAEMEAAPGVQRTVEMLQQQLVEVMPELDGVGAWHSVGQRRTQDELGRIAEDVVPSAFARDSLR